MCEEETDLSFADFGGSKRLYPALASEAEESESDNPLVPVARREGFEPPTLRFEGTAGFVRGSPYASISNGLGLAHRPPESGVVQAVGCTGAVRIEAQPRGEDSSASHLLDAA